MEFVQIACYLILAVPQDFSNYQFAVVDVLSNISESETEIEDRTKSCSGMSTSEMIVCKIKWMSYYKVQVDILLKPIEILSILTA